MNTRTITRAMIESAVSSGIRSMEENPKRSIRRLADLGKQFSRSRFQDDFFTIMQDLLENENNKYYDFVANVLANCDHDTIKTIGMNFGYSSWTYGGRVIRRTELESGFAVPLTMMLRWSPELCAGNAPGALTVPDIDRLVKEGMELGIYSYFIREDGKASDSYELLDLFGRYPECCFVLIRPSGRVTAAQIQLLKLCRNALFFFPVDDEETYVTVPLLRNQKILFGLYSLRGGSRYEEPIPEDALRRLISVDAPFYLRIADDDVTEEQIAASMDYCYRLRLHPEYPCVIIEYYGDGETLSGRVGGHRELLEIGPDRKVIRPLSSAGMEFPMDRPLAEALREVMPKIDTTEIREY